MTQNQPLSKEDMKKINKVRKAVYDLCFRKGLSEAERGALKDLLVLPDIFSEKVQGLLDELNEEEKRAKHHYNNEKAANYNICQMKIKKWLGAVIE